MAANILYFYLTHTHTHSYSPRTQTALPLWKRQVIVCLHCLVYFIISFWCRFIYNTAYISLQLSSWGVLFILQLLINHFRERVSGADGAPLSLHCGPWQHLLIRDASQNLSCTILSHSPSTDLSSAMGSCYVCLPISFPLFIKPQFVMCWP